MRSTWSTRVVAVTLLAVVAGCGGSPKKGATPAPMTAAQAQSLAAAAVLTAADLPGFQVKKQTHTTQDDADEALLTTCLGLGKVTYLARDFGLSFTKGPLSVDSSADVATSAAAAKREYAALTRPAALGCAKAQGTKVMTAAGLSVRNLTLTPFDVGLAGVTTFGYRIAVQATVKGRSFAISGYQLGALAAGRVEVSLDAIDLAGAPSLTLSQLVGLLSTATQRATAAAA